MEADAAEKGDLDNNDADLARITGIVLAEFAGLRSEISTRINLQTALSLGNLTVVGVVVSIALARPGNGGALLVLPLVVPQHWPLVHRPMAQS
jgi:hypothetical protein